MVEINFLEKDIEDYLCRHPYKDSKIRYLSKWFENLVFVKRQFKIEGLIIDILAYNIKHKTFVIVELKKGDIDPSAFAQVLTYKRLMEAKYPTKRFATLLIGKNLDERLSYVVESYNSKNFTPFNTYYQLYNYDFEDGISFSWINTAQKEISAKMQNLRQEYWNKQIGQELQNGDIQKN